MFRRLQSRSFRPAMPVALPILIVMLAGGCGLVDVSPSDNAAEPTVEVTDEIVGCGAATIPDGDAPSIDLGSVVVGPVADADRVAVDGGTEVTFVVEIEPLDPAGASRGDPSGDDASNPVDDGSATAASEDSAAGSGQLAGPGTLAILQARTVQDTAVLLRIAAVPEAGADRPGPVSALSFARCDEPVRHEVTLLVTEPGCLVLVGNDPTSGGFTELPVRIGVDACPETPLPTP